VFCFDCTIVFDPRDGTVDANGTRTFRRWQLGEEESDKATNPEPVSIDVEEIDTLQSDLHPTMALRAAVLLYKREERTPINSYEWYRLQAARSGHVSLGDTQIQATKVHGAWTVNSEDVATSIAQHRLHLADEKRATDDYAHSILQGRDGERVATTWGYYEIRGGVPLHLVVVRLLEEQEWRQLALQPLLASSGRAGWQGLMPIVQ
jgi:hypothetical protein